ncbi:MAG: RimK family alpha-L-glutamate ligase [Methanotrichaceae archaeon]|nr:RimK family alpha-L-glutamate ligase [Methanotrichaceae archaeon]
MRLGIVISDAGDWMARSFQIAFQARGVDARFLNLSDLAISIDETISFVSNGIDLQKLDLIVVRDLGRKGAHDIAMRFELLNALQGLGIIVINPPAAIAAAANKSATSMALQRLGIPTPKTTVTTDPVKALETLHTYGKAVSKPLFGYKGRDVLLLSDGDKDKLCKIIEKNGFVYLQEFVESPCPRDIRAFVVRDRVVGAIYRIAPAGAWISNLAQGGKAEPCALTEELMDLAVRANHAVGAIYSGVDLLETQEGLKVIEVNGTPSGFGIYQALRIDVTEAIADTVLEL